MNILLLGGMGFLGQSLVHKLSLEHTVFIADCNIQKEDEKYFRLSLNDTDKLFSLLNEKKIDILIHLVSSIIPTSDFNLYFKDINDIYCPSVKLMDYCADNNIRFVYFSSGGAVYGNQKEIFNERTKREPVSYYGLSKLNFENTVSFLHYTKNLEYMIIRPSNPYGFGQNINGKQGLIAVIIGKILKNEPLQIWGDGCAVKDYIYIDDFVFYLSNLIIRKDTWNQIYNIGSGTGSSVKEVLNAFTLNGIKLPEIEYIGENKSDVKRMILDCTKIQRLFSHECLPLVKGVKLFWEKQNNK